MRNLKLFTLLLALQLVGLDLRSDAGSYSDDERGDNSLEKGPEFIFRKLLRQASSLVEVVAAFK